MNKTEWREEVVSMRLYHARRITQNIQLKPGETIVVPSETMVLIK